MEFSIYYMKISKLDGTCSLKRINRQVCVLETREVRIYNIVSISLPKMWQMWLNYFDLLEIAVAEWKELDLKTSAKNRADLKLAFQTNFTQPDFLWKINQKIFTVCAGMKRAAPPAQSRTQRFFFPGTSYCLIICGKFNPS